MADPYKIRLPSGRIIQVSNLPEDVTRGQIKAKLISSGAADPQEFVPTQSLEQSAAASAPNVSAASAVENALRGAWQAVGGMFPATASMLKSLSPTGLTGAETARNIMTPTDQTNAIVNAPASSMAGKIILGGIPGAMGAASTADLAARAAGLSPLTQQSIPELQANTANLAGQVAATAGAMKIGQSPSQESVLQKGQEQLRGALGVPPGKGGIRAAKMASDVSVASPHLAEIARQMDYTPRSFLDKIKRPMSGNPEWLDDVAQKIDSYKQQLWKQQHESIINRHADAPFDWNKVKAEAESSILPEDDVGQAKLAQQWLDRNIGQLRTLKNADTKVRLLNQEIKSLPERYGPVGARVRMALQNALRQQIESQLTGQFNEPGVIETNQAYGALKNVQGRLEEQYYRETNKASKASPLPDWLHAYAFMHPGEFAAFGVGINAARAMTPGAAALMRRGIVNIGNSGIRPDSLSATSLLPLARPASSAGEPQGNE